jgi:hypothetical protein
MVINGNIDANILIIGSSRGARDIIASQISDQTGQKCFNLSYPASDISFHEFLLEQLLKNNRKKPEIVILTMDDPFEFINNKSIKFRLDRLYPLVKYAPIREALVERGEKNKFLSEIFILHQLNKSNFDIRKKNIGVNDTILKCGSMPINSHGVNNAFSFGSNAGYNVRNESQAKKENFAKFIEICKKNNIKLILAFPPNFQHPNADFQNRVFNLSNTANVFHFNYDTSKKEYRDKKFYYDNSHLNYEGSKIFTTELSDYIMHNTFLRIADNAINNN